MRTLAIIPARGGSKRIPKKNIRLFCGKPIIAYSIENALKSGLFDTVMVSTDDEEIAEIAKKNGAEVPFYRSKQTSSDYATTADVLYEVLSKYQNEGCLFDRVCCIYPTAPFVTIEKLVEAFGLLDNMDTDSVVPIVEFEYSPYRALEVVDDKIIFVNKEYEMTRSQDLKSLYHDCGQFYFLKVAPFLEHREVFLPNTKPIIISRDQAQDIDTEEDWKMAEIKYSQLKLEKV